ncbi:hypothetical protein N7466_009413 [Penicillium verhagenii]|uniref:uncharacterized protein n=1 Tax=Penicillium verhagenii TaxID=1562060 RepID=UPI002544DF56|nr:uncharacterized protein N7466_009413 [Penicillium verhagenii]KAJ5921087.1 hypothetical protein N7466_009413 [Penicillium verhagenii]
MGNFDNSNNLWENMETDFQFPSDEDIMATEINNITYDSSVSGEPWQNDFDHLICEFIPNGGFNTIQQEIPGDIGELPDLPSPTKIRKFEEFHNLYSHTFSTTSNTSDAILPIAIPSDNESSAPDLTVPCASQGPSPKMTYNWTVPSQPKNEIERLSDRMGDLDRRFLELETRFGCLQNSLENFHNTVNEVGEKIKIFDGYLIEIIKREKEAMEEFLQLKV